ncbi:hypothetical protein J7K74_03795 [Candidatus Woesearchaeota archaeon]|nr:hypothetical protein [Candidatus Woesearchaeota archaeon]
MSEERNVMHINLSDALQEKVLMDRSEKASKTISIRINKTLLELVREKIRELKEQGYNVSLNYIIHKLLIAFLKAPISISDNAISINIERIEIENRAYNRRKDVMHMQMHMQMHYDRSNIPNELRELIRKVVRALKEARSMDKENRHYILGRLLEELYKYKEYGIAQHFISVIEYELSR